MADVIEDNDISIQSHNISYIFKDEGDVDSCTLSNASIVTISKYIDMISEQNANVINPNAIEVNPEDNKDPLIKLKTNYSKPSAVLTNQRISEQIKTEVNKMYIQSQKKNNMPYYSYKNYIANVSINKLKTLHWTSTKYIDHSNHVNQHAINTLSPSLANQLKEIQTFTMRNQNQTNSTFRNNIPQAQAQAQAQANNPIPNLLGFTSPTSPVNSKIKQMKYSLGKHALSEHNVIHISNQLQQNKKKMLLGLYKNKIEFEDELDNFKSQLEKRNKRLLDNESYATITTQINNPNTNTNIKSKSIRSVLNKNRNDTNKKHYRYNTLSHL